MGLNVRKIHKWMAILAGTFLFLWLVSGILMVLPHLPDKPSNLTVQPKFDWRKATHSPMEAISVVEARLGRSVDVKKLELLSLLGNGFYRISLRNGQFFLVSSMSGGIEELNAEKAEMFLRSFFSEPIQVKEKQQLNQYSFDYLWGPLPVMRFVLADPPGVLAYISLGNGSIRWSSQWTAIRGFIESFHTFDPIKLLVDRKVLSRMALIFVSLIGIGVVMSGALLVWNPFRR